MNKKLIDLFIEYSKDKKQPEKVMFDGNKYTYDGWSCLSQIIEAYGKNIVGYLNDEVEILDDEDKNSFTGWKMYQNGKEVASMDCSYDEDMEIEELHIINGAVDGKWENGSSYNYTLSAPQTVIIKKVNELVREINKLKKEGK